MIRGKRINWGETEIFFPSVIELERWQAIEIPRIIPEKTPYGGIFRKGDLREILHPRMLEEIANDIYKTWEDARPLLAAIKAMTGSFPEGFPIGTRTVPWEPNRDLPFVTL